MKLPILAATVLGLTAGLSLSTLPSYAQNKGTPPTTTTPPGGATTNTPSAGSIPGTIPGGTNIPGNRTPTGPGTIPGQMPTQQQPGMPMPVFLSGKVVLSDGTPPPDSVVIERVCGAKRFPEAYTDSKGHFSFEVGHNKGMIPDASIGSWDDSQPGSRGSAGIPGAFGGSADMVLAGCELRASLAGYESSVVDLSMHRRLDNPDVGTIVLRRLAAVEGSTISMTSLEAPKDAKKLYEKGAKAVNSRKWQDAQKSLEKAVEIYPKYAAAWYELGRAYAGLGNAAEARKSFEQSLAADGKFLKPYLAIADLDMKDKNWKALADNTGLLIKLDPIDYPGAYLYNSFAYFSMNNLDAAEKSAREGIRIDSAHNVPKMEHILGVILANKRDYAGAAAAFKAYLEYAPNAGDADTVRKQLAEVERVAALANSQQKR
jgi:tetratricopeptide (TPR) repeat protein